ncbi:serine/threonine protein kinase [Leptolyngbya sp. AN03gr2]|uniref:serine/threonine protein kinase n=1 Tax=unclassified Leptolyngbya TaxID=2650499 RepID=UPI003D3136B3
MTHSSDRQFVWQRTWDHSIDLLLEQIYQALLPSVEIHSVDPHDPVEVTHVPSPWQVLGTGNYAAVFTHPDFPEQVVKIYASNRPGFDEEQEVYRRLGSHPAFSECFYAHENLLVLKRLYGMTLYDCLHYGKRIPPSVIRDIDRALIYAQSQGLFPHDVHARNVMMAEGQGLVVDVSDFLHPDYCAKWDHFKRAYYWLYLPIVAPLRLRVPHSWLNRIRKTYRRLDKKLLNLREAIKIRTIQR